MGNSLWFRASWVRWTGARSSKQLPASANRSSFGRRSGAPPLTAWIRRRHTKVALSAVRAHRGTEGSNPFPSSGESRKLQLIGEGSDEEITAEPDRRSSAMQLAPGDP